MFSGLPPIAEVPLPVNVSVSPVNVSAYGVLHSDKRLSQYPELAMRMALDLSTNTRTMVAISHCASIFIQVKPRSVGGFAFVYYFFSHHVSSFPN